MRHFGPLLTAIGAAAIAMPLAWLAISVWSPILWGVLGVGIIVFVIVLYFLNVSIYLRMARMLLVMLFITNFAGVGIRFIAGSDAYGFIDFVSETGNLWANAFLVICFLGVLAADVILKRAELSAASAMESDKSSALQVAHASDGSVSVQNSPGARITVGSQESSSKFPSDKTEKLIDTVQAQASTLQTQASVIDRLISRQDIHVEMQFTSNSIQDSGKVGSPTVGQSSNDRFPVKQMMQRGAVDVESSGLIRHQEGAELTDFIKSLQNVDTADGIAAEIRQQLLVWNNGAALILAERLEEHLHVTGTDVYPRLSEHLYLLARVHVIHAENNNKESTQHIMRARKFLERIDATLPILPNIEIATAVEALRGSIENIENGPVAAMAKLAMLTDPYAIRTRLAMHLKKQDVDGALALIEERPLHLIWCDLAAVTYAAKDRREDALEVVMWAKKQDDRSKYPQCVVRFADSILVRALANQEPGKNILPQDLSDEERDNVQEVLSILQPVLLPIITAGSVDSELDRVAIKIAWQAYHLLGQRDDVAKLARLMYTHRPVQPDVAISVISGYLAPPPDLPARLRKDHPRDFDANILAAVVQSTCIGQHEEAFAEAKSLLPLANTDEKKEELFKLFQQIWQNLDGESLLACEQIALPLIAHSPNFKAVFNASRALRAGNADLALEELDRAKAEDDVNWLQLRANALMQKGQLGNAVDFLLIAARKTGEPELLHKTADLAFEAKKVAIAVECYEQLLIAQPENQIARGNLAALYTFHLHDIREAAAQFRALHKAEPDNLDHTVNLAICLAQLYQPRESLSMYDKACDVEKPDIRAVLGRAELHLSMGDPDAALSSLQEFRGVFWDIPDFLLACMNTSYASGDEVFANDAFEKLNALRVAGSVDEKAMRLVKTDEALEMFKQLHRESEERKQYTHTEMIKGRMPWVRAAQLSGDAIYWVWRIRTQEMGWISDDPVNRASFCIYATNGFHARKTEDDHLALLPMECPPPGTRVVADISALITLHRLELLDLAADYFGEILIPEGYLPTVLEDGKKMVLHQRSRQQTADRIAKLVSDKTIVTIDRLDEQLGSMAAADEYGDSGIHRYHLTDLIGPIYKLGLISDISYLRISKIFTKPASADRDHPTLVRFQNVFIELATLETITSFGLLDVTTGFYRIHIASEAQTEIRQRLDAIRFQEETRVWHFDLWDRIRDSSKFRFIPHTIPDEIQSNNAEIKSYLAFFANLIAQDEGIPLLADDRVCQAMTLNKWKGRLHAAFGSNAVLLALEFDERLSSQRAAEKIFELMNWRYRFIIPPAEHMRVFAAQYCANPPGHPLQMIAEYIHDCMRDSGLFGGPENTDLKDSMAMRLYLSWQNTVAEFIMQVWGDSAFTDDTAKQLTEWCIWECMPCYPSVLNGCVKVRIGSMAPRLLLSHALINASSLTNDGRVSNAMQAMQDSLKLSDDEYLHIVTEILNDTRRTEPKP